MPASCMVARLARVCDAVGLKPGKPGVPAKVLVMVLPSRSTWFPLPSVTGNPLRTRLACPPVTNGLMYLYPYRAEKPLYPPGSVGNTSGTARWAPTHAVSVLAQWTASPTYFAVV